MQVEKQRRLAITGVLVLAAVTLGSPQSAIGALKEKIRTVTKPGPHTATANCPDGWHVVSGGGYAGTFQMSLGQSILNASFKSSNGWTARGDSDNTTDPFPVTAYAYCSEDSLRLRTFRARTRGAPRTTTDVACETGNIVSGGGEVVQAKVPTFTYGLPFANLRRANGWRFGADSTYEAGIVGAQTDARAFAYCTPARYRLATVTATRRIDPNRIGERTARCPAGTELVSGGGSTGSANKTVMWLSHREANGWEIRATNYDTSSSTITVYAYCH